jgi:hypothetical protein
VLGCSTAGIDQEFIKQMMRLGAPFDVLTIHPYRGGLDDCGFVDELHRTSELARQGDGTVRPVWITEMGWPTYTPHNTMKAGYAVTTQRRQAELIVRAYVDAIVSGVVPNISWYDFRNDGDEPYDPELNMGIVLRDFRPKPACRAYATMTKLLKGRRFDKDLSRADLALFRFVGADGSVVTVLWAVGPDATVELDGAGPMLLTNLMGETQRLLPANGKVSVAVRHEVPAFVTPGP